MAGAGPKYVLPTLTGFENHDPRKFRYPAWSVGFRDRSGATTTGTPGPKYDPQKYYRTGRYTGPSALVLARRDQEVKFNGIPASINYIPGPDPSYDNSPSAVVLSRKDTPTQSGVIPGPKYLVKSTFGRPIEHLTSAPAWTILARNIRSETNLRSPGPRYGAVDLKLTKRRYPEATLTSRNEPLRGSIVPAPKYNGPYRALKSQEPSWTFGVKHSEKQAMLLTDVDRTRFYGF